MQKESFMRLRFGRFRIWIADRYLFGVRFSLFQHRRQHHGFGIVVYREKIAA